MLHNCSEKDCVMSFATKWHLEWHHIDDHWVHKCEYCGIKFKNQRELTKHEGARIKQKKCPKCYKRRRKRGKIAPKKTVLIHKDEEDRYV